jgi:hypothetical protein
MEGVCRCVINLRSKAWPPGLSAARWDAYLLAWGTPGWLWLWLRRLGTCCGVAQVRARTGFCAARLRSSYNKFIFVHAFGSVMFMYENMDIKDGFTTSSKEQLRSLFVFMSLMKSLPMVARTEVLRRNIPED